MTEFSSHQEPDPSTADHTFLRRGRSPDFDQRPIHLPRFAASDTFRIRLPDTVTASLRILTGFPFHLPVMADTAGVMKLYAFRPS